MASKSVGRFRGALAKHGLPDTIVALERGAHTASEAADALGCAVGQIVKSLVFAEAGNDAVLVLAAGDVRVDEARLGEVHGAPLTLGDAAFVRAATGYAIGGVPPFGHERPLPTLIDRTLERWDTVWAAAGTPRHVFSLPVAELLRVTGGHLADVG